MSSNWLAALPVYDVDCDLCMTCLMPDGWIIAAQLIGRLDLCLAHAADLRLLVEAVSAEPANRSATPRARRDG